MPGFTDDALIVGRPDELPSKLGREKVVLVCHGTPLQTPADDPDAPATCPKLLEVNLHALLLAQRPNAATESKFRDLKEYLAGGCERVYRLTVGWNNLAEQAHERERIIAFLKSDEVVPSDRLVQRLLGFDLPVTRLALRAALEVAAEELGGPTEAELPPGELLAPALELARREPSLAGWVSEIEGSLGDTERLRSTVGRVLEALIQDSTVGRGARD
jgi:hypothetical protein